MKCIPQWCGLTRQRHPGNTKRTSANRRAWGAAIATEAMCERNSDSPNLDRSLSGHNRYEGQWTSGAELWQEVERQAAEYRVTVKGRGGTHERALRSDAVVAWAVIIHPPARDTVGWDAKTWERWDHDAWECLCQMPGRHPFRNDNVLGRAVHYDEGFAGPDGTWYPDRHEHRIGMMRDEAGKIGGKGLWDIKLFRSINERWPAMMRDRGWDVEDVDLTDPARMQVGDDGKAVDPEYREARLTKRREQGLSGREITARRTYEAQIEQMQAEIDRLESHRRAAQPVEESVADSTRYLREHRGDGARAESLAGELEQARARERDARERRDAARARCDAADRDARRLAGEVREARSRARGLRGRVTSAWGRVTAALAAGDLPAALVAAVRALGRRLGVGAAVRRRQAAAWSAGATVYPLDGQGWPVGWDPSNEMIAGKVVGIPRRGRAAEDKLAPAAAMEVATEARATVRGRERSVGEWQR